MLQRRRVIAPATAFPTRRWHASKGLLGIGYAVALPRVVDLGTFELYGERVARSTPTVEARWEWVEEVASHAREPDAFAEFPE